MENIKNFIETIKAIQINQIIDIIIGILIYILFRCLSRSLAYITIKIFKPKTKNKKIITNNPFFSSLKIFYTFLGLYIAILFLKQSLLISDYIMLIINKIFRIIIIALISKGFADSLNTNFVSKLTGRINPKLDDSMLRFMLKAIKVIIYIIAGFIIITELGYNLNGLATGLGIGSIVITLAAQDTAKNLFGGLVIFFDKPFIVGDWIQMGSYEGTVEDITFRSTRLRTFENSVVNIPNSIIANDSITNWSRMEKRRNKINLCLELDTPLEKVRTVQERIKEMLKQNNDIIDNTIRVNFDTIADNGINILIYVYTNSIDYASFIEEKEKINYKIMQILREEKVELAYDTKSIYIKKQ